MSWIYVWTAVKQWKTFSWYSFNPTMSDLTVRCCYLSPLIYKVIFTWLYGWMKISAFSYLHLSSWAAILQANCCESGPGFFLFPVKSSLRQTLFSPMYLLQQKLDVPGKMLLWSSNLHLFWAAAVAIGFIWSKDCQQCLVLGSGVLRLYLHKTLLDSSGCPFTWVCVKRKFNVGSVTSVSPTLHLLPYPKFLFNVVLLVTWFSVERELVKKLKTALGASTRPWFSDHKCLPTVNYSWFLPSSELWGAY